MFHKTMTHYYYLSIELEESKAGHAFMAKERNNYCAVTLCNSFF